MRVLWCLALVFGVSLGAQQRWNVEKTRQCSCSSNATAAFLSAVPRTCITDAKSRRVKLRLSPPEEGCCEAKVGDDTAEIDIHLTYDGKLRGASLLPADPAEVEYVLKVDVERGVVYDPTKGIFNSAIAQGSSRDPYRRKRDLRGPDLERESGDLGRESGEPGKESGEPDFKPFSSMTFTITLNMDQEPDCDMEDLIKEQMMEGVKAFWLKMTNCLLDVSE